MRAITMIFLKRLNSRTFLLLITLVFVLTFIFGSATNAVAATVSFGGGSHVVSPPVRVCWNPSPPLFPYCDDVDTVSASSYVINTDKASYAPSESINFSATASSIEQGYPGYTWSTDYKYVNRTPSLIGTVDGRNVTLTLGVVSVFTPLIPPIIPVVSSNAVGSISAPATPGTYTIQITGCDTVEYNGDRTFYQQTYCKTGTISITVTSAATPPTFTTNAAGSVTSSGATLNGTGNPNGKTTTGWFRYSTTNPGTCNDSFGTRAPASLGTNLFAGASGVAYNASISGLSASTLYYYCAIGSNADGTAWGSPATFTTSAAAGSPDLTVTTDVTPTTATAGTAQTFSATIKNQGTGSTGASFDSYMQIATVDAVTTPVDVTAVSISTLGSGATATFSKAYTFSKAGRYTITVCADKSNNASTGTISESNEGNNCGAAINVSVSPVVSFGASTPITRGNSTTLTWTITGVPQRDATTGMCLLGPPINEWVTLAEAGDGTHTRTYSPTADTTYDFQCWGIGGFVESTRIYRTVVVQEPAAVNVCPATASVVVASTVNLTAWHTASGVAWTGCDTHTGATNVTSSASWTPTTGAIAKVGGSTGVVTGMSAGGPVTITASYLSLNSNSAVTVTSAAIANLTADAIVSPATATVGVAVSIVGRIRNTGTAASSGAFTNRFRVNTAAVDAGSTDIGTGPTSVGIAVAGTSDSTMSAQYTFSSAGTYYLSVCADSGAAIAESNDGDNCGAWTAVTVSAAPSVSVTLTGVGCVLPVSGTCDIKSWWAVSGLNVGETVTMDFRGPGYLLAIKNLPSDSSKLAKNALKKLANSFTALSPNVLSSSPFTKPAGSAGTFTLTLRRGSDNSAIGSALTLVSCPNGYTNVGEVCVAPSTPLTSITLETRVLPAGAWSAANRTITPGDEVEVRYTAVGTVSGCSKDSGPADFSLTHLVTADATVTEPLTGATTVFGITCTDGTSNRSDTVSVTASSGALPDLRASTMPGGSVVAGSTTVLPGFVSNSGSVGTPAGVGFNVLFQRATDSSGTGATDIGTYWRSTAVAGSGGWFDANFSYSGFTTPGTFYVRACADKDAGIDDPPVRITESNEDNNCGNSWSKYDVAPLPTPTASLSATSPINSGQSSTLTWDSTNATSCTSAGFATGNATSGTVTVGPLCADQNYQTTCTGPGGSADSPIAQVIVTQPTMTLTATPERVRLNAKSKIEWSATPSYKCSIAGPGLNIASTTSGSRNITMTQQSKYTLTCIVPSCTPISKSVIVNLSEDFQHF